MTEAKGVEAVERALQILDCFRPGMPSLSLAELARETGQYKSTILRLAISLERYGYVIREDGGRFRLGPSAWRIGSTYRQSFDLADVIRPELQLLSAETNETASYYIREGDSRVCLFRSEPLRAIRHSIVEGARMPVSVGATGKILLAFSANPDEGSSQIRDQGYAVSLGEREPDVAAIAVPVLSPGGRVLGALAVSGLISRFGAERHESLIAALTQSCARLSSQITIRE